MHDTDADNCRLALVNVTERLYEDISKEHCLILPTEEPIKVKKVCTSAGFEVTWQPSLEKIPSRYNIDIKNAKFRNEESLVGS